jgi:ABC-type uncharacterized transport system permease subunit
MSGLPIPETIIFLLATVMYAVAAIVGIIQLRAGGEKYNRFMQPVVCMAVVFEAVVLIFRAAAIKAIPLTGLFESMIVLTIVFGLTYLFLSIAIKQVWFSSVMVWLILAIVLMSWAVARPAAEPTAVAGTPWAIAHGIAMILGGAAITFATASALLYLLGSHKLKQKKIMQVLGKVPNIERLEYMNLLGIKIGFLFITIGLISGLGLATFRLAILGISISEWLTDAKVICIITAWVLLAAILILNRLLLLKSKARAFLTIMVFAFILFGILGVAVSGATHHDFSGWQMPAAPMAR